MWNKTKLFAFGGQIKALDFILSGIVKWLNYNSGASDIYISIYMKMGKHFYLFPVFYLSKVSVNFLHDISIFRCCFFEFHLFVCIISLSFHWK